MGKIKARDFITEIHITENVIHDSLRCPKEDRYLRCSAGIAPCVQ